MPPWSRIASGQRDALRRSHEEVRALTAELRTMQLEAQKGEQTRSHDRQDLGSELDARDAREVSSEGGASSTRPGGESGEAAGASASQRPHIRPMRPLHGSVREQIGPAEQRPWRSSARPAPPAPPPPPPPPASSSSSCRTAQRPPPAEKARSDSSSPQ